MKRITLLTVTCLSLVACSSPKQQEVKTIEVDEKPAVSVDTSLTEGTDVTDTETSVSASTEDSSSQEEEITIISPVEESTSSDPVEKALETEKQDMQTQSNHEEGRGILQGKMDEAIGRLRSTIDAGSGYEVTRLAVDFFNGSDWLVNDWGFLIEQGYTPLYDRAIIHRSINENVSQFLLPLQKENDTKIVKGFIVENPVMLQLEDIIEVNNT